MITLRKAPDRFHSHLGWLDSWHTFSFGDHYDERFEGFRALRVINDDRVAPGMGFGTHGHRDMEIVSYVLEGALAHKDNTGTNSIIRPGEVQRMSAGTGVMHSEFNASKSEPVHFLQIWIIPDKKGIAPGYEQKTVPPSQGGKFRTIASPAGEGGAVRLQQDVTIHSSGLAPGEEVSYTLAKGRSAWVHVATGAVTLNGQAMGEGDGAAVTDEQALELKASKPSEVLVFDLA